VQTFFLHPAGTKEQAFVYALTSASVAHAVAKACANGALFDCPCGAAPRTHPDGNFKWGGCGDNIAFGVTISKKFLDVLERGRASRVKVEDDEELQSFQPVINRKRSILALVNLHNNRAGRRVSTMLCSIYNSAFYFGERKKAVISYTN